MEERAGHFHDGTESEFRALLNSSQPVSLFSHLSESLSHLQLNLDHHVHDLDKGLSPPLNRRSYCGLESCSASNFLSFLRHRSAELVLCTFRLTQ